MPEPGAMIIPMLREMRAEMGARFDGVDRRLAAIETAQASFKQALTADSLPSKLVTGEFEQRIESPERQLREYELLERRVRKLETQK